MQEITVIEAKLSLFMQKKAKKTEWKLIKFVKLLSNSIQARSAAVKIRFWTSLDIASRQIMQIPCVQMEKSFFHIFSITIFIKFALLNDVEKSFKFKNEEIKHDILD